MKTKTILYVTNVALITVIFLTLAFACSIQDHNKQKEIQDLNTRLTKCKSNISICVKDLESTRNELQEVKDELYKYTNPIEYDAAAVPIYDIPLSEELQRHTYERCVFYGCERNYEFILALMWQESNFEADRISASDDYGIMQINKVNHDYLREHLGIVDIMDPKENINAGVYIYSTLYDKYENTHKTLMAYNMGPTKASKCWVRGECMSFYSESVVEKAGLILSNKYE